VVNSKQISASGAASACHAENDDDDDHCNSHTVPILSNPSTPILLSVEVSVTVHQWKERDNYYRQRERRGKR
jgi:hypothetical protein